MLIDALHVNGMQYCIHGDQAYLLRPWMQTAYPRLNPTENKAHYNAPMNSARVAVEWSYKDMKLDFVSQEYHRKLQVRKVPVANMYSILHLHYFVTRRPVRLILLSLEDISSVLLLC